MSREQIKLFFVHGTPSGVTTAEITNRTAMFCRPVAANWRNSSTGTRATAPLGKWTDVSDASGIIGGVPAAKGTIVVGICAIP
jgi:hypothetical protein